MAASEHDEKQPGYAAWQLVYPFRDAIRIYDGPIAFLDGYEKVPPAVGLLYAVRWCDHEVCNGGFHQFFSNSTGVLAPEALDGFRAIGLVKLAKIVEAAMSHFDEPFPRDRDSRQEALEKLIKPGEKRAEWDPFYELDDQFYEAKDESIFLEKLDEFARRK